MMGSTLCMISFIHYHYNFGGSKGEGGGGGGGGGMRGEGRPVKSHSLGVILTPCPLAFSTQIHDCQVSLYSSKSLAVNDQISQSHCYTRKSHCKSQIHDIGSDE